MPQLIAATMISLLLVALSGCGNKGPLSLPAEPATQSLTTD